MLFPIISSNYKYNNNNKIHSNNSNSNSISVCNLDKSYRRLTITKPTTWNSLIITTPSSNNSTPDSNNLENVLPL